MLGLTLVKASGDHNLIQYQDRQDLKKLKNHLDKAGVKVHFLPMDSRTSRRMSPLAKYVGKDGRYADVILK